VRYGRGLDGIGSVIVERDTPGFTVGTPSSFMSGEQWSELHFENCRIPAANVLLGPGGFKKQIASFNIERLGNSARSLALGRYAYNAARDHCLTREQFGRPLCEFQGLQWKFAEMAIKLESAQLLLYRAATNADRGLPSAYETAVAKAACNQTGFEVSHEAVQAMGALGYSREALVEYCMRRCRGWMIAGGSIEMLKNRIAEHVFDRRFDQRPPRRAEAAE
jgi:alkylation response protein AidB-like acyl-CoA dehydrogenase